ncbi:GD18694 [Drosophila simulans]|uniref:GD18694 n=1 Tax=Drosophila simulans TaxID=7240 RepID=B4QV78_DROSI|nr:GD18694 [Drosophila simulans]
MLSTQWNANKQISRQVYQLCRGLAQKATAVSLEEAKPYADIPGPSKLQLIRAFLPGGRYKNLPVHEMFLDMNRQYGSIFRMPSVAGTDMVLTMNPQDYEVIFRNEGQYPYRRSFEVMDYFKRVHRREVFDGYDGLTSGNGPAWGKMRTAVNPILLQPRNAKLYMTNLVQVSDEFLERIRTIRDPVTQEMPDDFAVDIRHLVIESICSVALNTHLGLLGEQRNNKDIQKLVLALQDVVELGFQLDIMPAFWKYLPMPNFKKLMRSLDTITDFCYFHIGNALKRIEEDAKAGKLNEKGLENSLWENLSKSPDKQARLLEEIRGILPNKDSLLTMENMRNLPYLRACIKEGIRMYPIGPGTLRRMPHDVVLSGYRVVAGTDVGIAANYQMANMEQFVPKVREFIPERWLRDESNSHLVGETATPFMYLPFGFGPRSCAGKRIVDMMLEIAISRLVRNFEIGFDYPIENAFKAKFFVQPNIPFKFKFIERSD